ncbi:unnamed protein product [Caenorhabditis bovis]|uniref:RNA polymerase II-associated protein 1 N-terminal domain-containing protein n=1 Tax=Caenorhabditis bovis TaxID=2654633 RepID=A0A8S1F264_9PELO|nr:unnamed protein product [Caenorhabditis bovis]
MDNSMFLKRPTPADDEDEILEMQRQWEAAKSEKPTVQIHKMKRKKVENEQKASARPLKEHTGRFTIDLDEIKEESDAQNVLFGVVERNSEWLTQNKTDEMLKTNFAAAYSNEDGFPEPLYLKAYYCENETTRRAPSGKSFFAAEFDRIHGKLEENLDEAAMKTVENVPEKEDFEAENDKFLAGLDMEKVKELRGEIEERLNPKMIEFLMNRKKKVEKPKVSKFKSRRLAEKLATSEPTCSTEAAPPRVPAPNELESDKKTAIIEDMLNELEVLDEFANQDDREKYNRLATDAVQLDMTAKFGRNLVSRQQKNALRLFDSCKFRPNGYDGSDSLRESARDHIEDIKKLYLEEVEIGGKREFEFGRGVNPILDSCWTLVPARKVLDAVEKRQGIVTADDVEIVKYAILWTFLMFEEKKSAFFAFSQPNDFYVHLSEIFLIGAEILADDLIIRCVERLMNGYVIKAASEGRLSLRMNAKVAGIDAFMPFFENLLKNFEQYSLGDVQFSRAILIGAYLNAPIGDSLEYRFAVWTPKRSIIRQMTIKNCHAQDILKMLKAQTVEREQIVLEQHYVQYTSLLGAYVAAIRDETITKERNELMWTIASFEIGRFVARRGQLTTQANQKELDVLVEIIRKSIGDKLML